VCVCVCVILLSTRGRARSLWGSHQLLAGECKGKPEIQTDGQEKETKRGDGLSHTRPRSERAADDGNSSTHFL